MLKYRNRLAAEQKELESLAQSLVDELMAKIEDIIVSGDNPWEPPCVYVINNELGDNTLLAKIATSYSSASLADLFDSPSLFRLCNPRANTPSGYHLAKIFWDLAYKTLSENGFTNKTVEQMKQDREKDRAFRSPLYHLWVIKLTD